MDYAAISDAGKRFEKEIKRCYFTKNKVDRL